MVFPTLATWLYFVVYSGQDIMRTLYAVSKIVQFGFPLIWVFVVLREPLRLARPSASGMLTGIAFGALAFALILVFYFAYLKTSVYMLHTPARLREKLQGFGAATPAAFLVLAAFISVIHSLLEEYYWRWFVFGRLQMQMSTAPAIAMSSLAFAAHHIIVIGSYLTAQHWVATLVFSGFVALGGAVWAWIYARTRSLYAAWISHMMVDAVLMVIGYDLVM